MAVYRVAMKTIAREAKLEEKVLLHPRPAFFEQNDQDSTFGVKFSNDADTAAIKRFVAAHAQHYTLCGIGGSGTCNGRGASYVVLSELRQFSDDDMGVAALVIMPERKEYSESYYLVRVKHGRLGWHVAGVQHWPGKYGQHTAVQ